MRRKLSLQAMIEISIFTALAMLIDFFPSIKPIPSISISLSMVPVFIIAFRWGFLASFVSGFLWGILQIALGNAWILTPAQAFIEYFVAFAFIGFAGFFAGLVQRNLRKDLRMRAYIWIVTGTLVGGAARYFWNFLAGIIFFKKYAIESGKTPVIFSLVTNGTAFFFSSIGCAVVLILLVAKAPQLITSVNRK